LLPRFTYFLLRSPFDAIYSRYFNSEEPHAADGEAAGTTQVLLILGFTSAVILSTDFTRPEVTVLGIGSAFLFSISLVLIEKLLARGKRDRGYSNAISVVGQARRVISFVPPEHESKITIRDISIAVSVVCFLASFLLEGHHIDPLANTPSVHNIKEWNKGWHNKLFFKSLGLNVAGVVIELLRCICIFAMVRTESFEILIWNEVISDYFIFLFCSKFIS